VAEAQVGYEIDKLLVDPIEYWVHRIKGGRRVAKWGPFLSETACRCKVEELQLADKDRLRIVPVWHTGLDDILEKHHGDQDDHR